MLSFYLIWTLGYFTLLWWMRQFWVVSEAKLSEKSFFPKVTLIIAFRNEASNIPSLSNNLRQLSYTDLQILLVDDHSEDNSFQILEQCFAGNSGVQVLKSKYQGKKRAIEYGVQHASGHIILCTDADCSFPELWVENMILPFAHPEIQLVAGAVLVDGERTFLELFQTLDWASILLLTNYFFATKEPLMCSAANLAYRKSAFEKVNGYEGNREYASGDDEFLLKKIHSVFGSDAVCYLSEKETLVITKAEPSWSALLSQRVRWASKWKAHYSFSHAFTAAAVCGVQAVWIGSWYLLFLGSKGLLAFIVVWLVKIAGEKISLGKVLKSLVKQPKNFDYVQSSLVHPFYVLRVGLGALQGNFSWKDRENKRNVNFESEK